ncbi:hypothetical protein D3C74_382060 [compost metagenome]
MIIAISAASRKMKVKLLNTALNRGNTVISKVTSPLYPMDGAKNNNKIMTLARMEIVIMMPAKFLLLVGDGMFGSPLLFLPNAKSSSYPNFYVLYHYISAIPGC